MLDLNWSLIEKECIIATCKCRQHLIYRAGVYIDHLKYGDLMKLYAAFSQSVKWEDITLMYLHYLHQNNVKCLSDTLLVTDFKFSHHTFMCSMGPGLSCTSDRRYKIQRRGFRFLYYNVSIFCNFKLIFHWILEANFILRIHYIYWIAVVINY